MTDAALFFTAYDRSNYLSEALASWRQVRGFYDWPVVAMIEPSYSQQKMVELFEELEHPNLKIIVNPKRYGVLHHPWVGFQTLFDRYNFVVRAEDDLIVSTDILEYFEWANQEYRNQEYISCVNAFTFGSGDSSQIEERTLFNPLIWGTWRDRWTGFMRSTWDHDYSTNNGTPGVQAGWDWNLNRIIPERNMKVVSPLASRVQNIGVIGTHSLPENFETAVSFEQFRDPTTYVLEKPMVQI